MVVGLLAVIHEGISRASLLLIKKPFWFPYKIKKNGNNKIMIIIIIVVK